MFLCTACYKINGNRLIVVRVAGHGLIKNYSSNYLVRLNTGCVIILATLFCHDSDIRKALISRFMLLVLAA